MFLISIADATSANTIERVVASRTFAVVQTTQGKVYTCILVSLHWIL